MSDQPATPQPTSRDLANAAARETIALKQAEEYGHVLRWSLGKFGPGWLPIGRHFLLDKEVEDRCRQTGERAVAAATVYTVRNSVGRKRHFTVTGDTVTECADYREGFGPMLHETHPTMTIEVRGEKVAPGRYSLCWAPIEIYKPLSAEELAALRVSREAGKARRADAKFAAENPLLASAGIERHDLGPEKGRGR